VFAVALNTRVAAGELPRIRALILNATFQEYTAQMWTEDSFDTSFAANYLGHWLLTLLLLQSMDRHEGWIVVLGSLSHE
jgi:NAD(P)-dependent dehydrogenase (short-subunit alcohol dehydrogenase family)